MNERRLLQRLQSLREVRDVLSHSPGAPACPCTVYPAQICRADCGTTLMLRPLASVGSDAAGWISPRGAGYTWCALRPASALARLIESATSLAQVCGKAAQKQMQSFCRNTDISSRRRGRLQHRCRLLTGPSGVR